MSFLKDYIDYFKDNPEGYWFKRKLYGWGWVPVRWQGWLTVLAFIGFVLWTGASLSSHPVPTDTQLAWFFIKIIAAIVVITSICYKTGEKPRWSWGPKKD